MVAVEQDSIKSCSGYSVTISPYVVPCLMPLYSIHFLCQQNICFHFLNKRIHSTSS